MSHQHAFFCDAVCGEAEIADLSVHGLDALHGCRGIVVGFQQPLACLVTPHLEIWKIDIDEALQQLYAFERIKR